MPRKGETAVRTGTSGTSSVRTQYVHTPGKPVTHPPGTLDLSVPYSLFSFFFFYLPPQVTVYMLTINTIISRFTSCDVTELGNK